MSDFSNSELRRLDLTLLLAFVGLLRHRKAATVAAELGLTQSAISQSLKRLRDIFGDELFLRRPYGMEPTAVAIALEAPVAAAIEALRGALGQSQAFNPKTAEGVVKISALDAEQSVLIPPLAQSLRKGAPGLELSVLPLGRRAAVDALLENQTDLAIGFIWSRPDSILEIKLYEESFLVVGQPHMIPAGGISLQEYCDAEHILVSPGGDMRGVVDDLLDELGKSRSVSLALPAFLPGLAAAARSNAIVTLPSRVARTFACQFGLRISSPPLAIRSFPISLFWHKRNERDPRLAWVRDLIRAQIQMH
jgi:DNA-binding transcriptional LysR family regulator